MATELHALTREEGTGLQKYGYTGRGFVAYNGVELEEYRKNATTNIMQTNPIAIA